MDELNTMDLLKRQVEKMINEAANSTCSGDALRFSQAAVNAANAIAQLAHVYRPGQVLSD